MQNRQLSIHCQIAEQEKPVGWWNTHRGESKPQLCEGVFSRQLCTYTYHIRNHTYKNCFTTKEFWAYGKTALSLSKVSLAGYWPIYFPRRICQLWHVYRRETTASNAASAHPKLPWEKHSYSRNWFYPNVFQQAHLEDHRRDSLPWLLPWLSVDTRAPFKGEAALPPTEGHFSFHVISENIWPWLVDWHPNFIFF